ncbi:MAG TPA: hypothetical protein VG028_12470 [Terriglobia bacterium]|nr:hypothetical protein [Terriglobia bacterium]
MMMSDDGNFELYMSLGFGFGLFSFFRGFKIYREYRLLEDTPEIPIRSIPMGLAHVHGKALGDQLVTSPVTQTPCFFYKVDIEQYRVDSKGNGGWCKYATDLQGVRFYLEDATGRVEIDPYNAEYDLLQTCKRKTGGGFGLGSRTISATAKNPALTLGPGADDAALFSYAQSVGRGSSSVSGALASVSLSSLFRGSNRNWSGGSRGDFRFAEYCILQDHWYDVTGTCVENPEAKDEHDRNMIMKGSNEPTFLISWQTEKNIEKNMRRRAMWHVFGGGALSVACLGALLLDFAWS